MSKPAFTKARFELLAELHEKRSSTVSDTYPPARWLVAEGFATIEEGNFGSTTFSITGAGDVAYEQARAKFEDVPAGPKP
mgnify:CR=1 FL=1